MENALAQDESATSLVARIRSRMTESLLRMSGASPADLMDGGTALADLNVDSLALVEMLWEVEQEYGMRISDLEVLKDMTIDAAARFLARQVPPHMKAQVL